MTTAMGSKHKGDVMERRRQHAYKPLRSPAQGFPMCAVCNQRPNASIHAEHNQHAQLVEQRDQLAVSLREMLSIVEDEGHADNYVPQVAAARNALATVEQGDGEQAKGGSGGE